MSDTLHGDVLPPARLTYGDLWHFCDARRQHEDASAGACSLSATEELAAGNRPVAERYGRAALYHAAAARKFETLQKLIGRIEGSRVLREESARLAAEEVQAAQAAEESDHAEV